jgi:hypothetical protein
MLSIPTRSPNKPNNNNIGTKTGIGDGIAKPVNSSRHCRPYCRARLHCIPQTEARPNNLAARSAFYLRTIPGMRNAYISDNITSGNNRKTPRKVNESITPDTKRSSIADPLPIFP